jgi:hypothetical protein
MEADKTTGIKFGRSLTYDQAMEIRSRYCALGISMAMLADEYGVNTKTIERIIYWETYRKPSFTVGRKSRHY